VKLDKYSNLHWAFVLNMCTKIEINPYIYIFLINFIIKKYIWQIEKCIAAFIACHKGKIRWVNPVSGTAIVRPVWGATRLYKAS